MEQFSVGQRTEQNRSFGKQQHSLSAVPRLPPRGPLLGSPSPKDLGTQLRTMRKAEEGSGQEKRKAEAPVQSDG